MQKKNRLALLDRDGVLNVLNIKNGYIECKKFFKWCPGAKQSIKYLKLNKYKVVIITNQYGITRNYFSYLDVIRLHK
jgi:D-glycero-D-manno-heptose 1,7-bisphosphate phosphatase